MEGDMRTPSDNNFTVVKVKSRHSRHRLEPWYIVNNFHYQHTSGTWKMSAKSSSVMYTSRSSHNVDKVNIGTHPGDGIMSITCLWQHIQAMVYVDNENISTHYCDAIISLTPLPVHITAMVKCRQRQYHFEFRQGYNVKNVIMNTNPCQCHYYDFFDWRHDIDSLITSVSPRKWWYNLYETMRKKNF